MSTSCVALPGAFNGLCARAIAQAGFQGCYVSGAATSVCAGVPDIGLLTLDHFAGVVREVAASSGLPVLADADTGFGEGEMARRTVIEYARAGAAGLHIEDQVFPKRCGHLDGKTLIPIDHALEKIQMAAAAARAVSGLGPSDPPGGFLVCARTDARGVEGFEAAVDRAAAYYHAGADMIFPEGLTSEDEFGRFAARMRRLERRSGGPAHPQGGPFLLANMTEFGKTPMIAIDVFRSLGYSCVIWPVTLLRVAMGAVTRALAEIRAAGSPEPLLGQMQTRQALYGLIGYEPGTVWEYPV